MIADISGAWHSQQPDKGRMTMSKAAMRGSRWDMGYLASLVLFYRIFGRETTNYSST